MSEGKKIAVFDFGGVLFKTSATAMYRDLFTQDGRTEDELQYFLKNIFTDKARSDSHIGNLSDVTAELARKNPEWAKYIEAFNADRDYIKQVRGVIPGMEKVLADIVSRGYEIYGVTNWAADTFAAVRAAYPSITNMFNKIVVSGEVGIKKPSPEIFRLAQKEFGNPDPQNVYFFDDKAENTEVAAASVGWNGVVFKNSETVREALKL